MRVAIAALVVWFAAGDARAELDRSNMLWPHINVGGEGLAGENVRSRGFRAHALMGRSFGDDNRRWMFALGGTLGAGSIKTVGEERRSLAALGPELQLGMKLLSDRGWEADDALQNRIYASVAISRVWIDEGRIDAPRIGTRVALGANWLASSVRRYDAPPRPDEELELLFVMVFPHQLELVWDRSAGSDRFGVAVAWGH